VSEIAVTVVNYGNDRNLVMQYTDPITGKRVTRSAGTRDEREAERRAGVWQDELNSGRYQAPSKLRWADFRELVDEQKLLAMPESSQLAYRVALDHVSRLVNPDLVSKLTPQVMSQFQAKALKGGMKPTTLARHLRHIKAVLRWGERQGLLVKAPAIEMPKVQATAKHRPITTEEFERMLVAVPKVRPHDAPAWQRLLTGLWLSGLRLSEAMALNWNDGPFVFDTTGKHPAFVIDASGQKSRRSEVAPATPDFCKWLLAETPEPQRVGQVFPIVDPKTARTMVPRSIGVTISKIGRKANVVVGTSDKVTRDDRGRLVKEPRKMFAGAHDLRRSFCSRWAKRVMPAVLQRLARHSHVATTMTYYVALGADDVAADLWADHATTESTLRRLVTSEVTSTKATRGEATDEKRETPLSQGLTGLEKVDRGGLEPPTPGFSVQCSTN